MPNVKVYDMNGREVGEMSLSEAVFGLQPNENAMHLVIKNHLANKRQGTQSTLTRAEVSGGGAKPWRQKGTGRARQGSTRSPQWFHGGIALGPKPRDYAYHINKKIRRLAMLSALSAKAASGDIVVVENLNLDEVKTKNFANFLKAVDASKKALVVTPDVRENVVKSARNIPGIKTTVCHIINVYDILNADKFIIDKDAVAKIEEVYAQ